MKSDQTFPTSLVLRISGISANQLKYWVKIGLIEPVREGKQHFFTFQDIVKINVVSSLRKKGLSLQTIRKGIDNLSRVLPPNIDPLSRIIILTDGREMIAIEKGMYFSATSMQGFFRFDTEEIQTKIIQFQTETNAVSSTDRQVR